MVTVPGQTRRLGWVIDFAVVFALAAGWIVFVYTQTGGHRAILYDTFRDMAWAENMRAGRIWSDPVLTGQSYWYAPGNPLLVTGLTRLTGWSVVDLYGYSDYWFNILIPVLVYVVARVTWGRLVALAALPAVFLGSQWWLTHVIASIPGIQGVAFNLVGLLCWHQCVGSVRTGGPRLRTGLWTLATGVVLALSTWHHPLCGMVLAGTILLHALLDTFVHYSGPDDGANCPRRTGLFVPMLGVGAVSAALTAPLIVHMLSVQAANPALLHFFANELVEPDFYAHAQAPLVVPAALVGVWFIARATPQTLWVVTYLLVGLAGQIAGYLGHGKLGFIPYMLPHEFQWHAQFALGLCAAVGIVGLGRALAGQLKSESARSVLTATSVTLISLAATGPGVRGASQAEQYLLDLEPLLAQTRDVRAWIRTNAPLSATFVCAPEVGYQLVSALTGRKCIVVAPRHTNPAVDVPQRSVDLQAMLEATNEPDFLELARRYGADYLLYVMDSPEALQAALAQHAGWAHVQVDFQSESEHAVIYRIHRAP